MSFRFATPTDIPVLVALVESAYRGDVSRQGWTTEADLLEGRRTGADDVGQCIANDKGGILVLERDGEIIACANVNQENGAGYFGMFSVRPSLQNQGLGKQMLAEAERIARDVWHLPRMRMTVIDVRDALIDFYQRRGYHRTGIKQPFPYGDERFGIPQRDDLQFEVLEKDLAP